MAYLIKSAKVLAKHSKYHNQTMDLLINRGKIEQISKQINPADHSIIESEHLHVSIGWCDIGTHIGEPGFEQRETIKSICDLAGSSGFTSLAIFPKTNPVLQHKHDLQYLINGSVKTPIDLLPVAALSRNCEGQEMIEYFDLHHAGAIAFSDGIGSNTSKGLLQRALEYLKAFDGRVIYSPSDYKLSAAGQMHEGATSISLGLQGIPESLEITNVDHALNLLEYTGGSIIFHAISSQESLDRIVRSGLSSQIGLTIPFMNLCETDEALIKFDENFKVMPPLRDEANKELLLKSAKNKHVDAIISNHMPYEIEEKQDAFPFSKFGASSLQALFPVLNAIPRTKLPLENIIDKISSGPRKLLNLELPEIEEGALANLTVFDPNINWELNRQTNQSISENNPYFGREMKGKVICVFNKNKNYFTPY